MSRLSSTRIEPILCYVTDRLSFPKENPTLQRELLLAKAEAAAAAGVDWIQVREKDLSGKECTRLTREALQRTAKSSANEITWPRVTVNDRLDVAISERAGGVHLGEKSLPMAAARRLVEKRGGEEDFLVGVSCHSMEAAKAAERDGADYVFFGPVFATPSKAEYGTPQGVELLEEVCRAVKIPVLAIGGITLENAAACFAAGALGIAAIRLFQDASDMPSVVRALRKATR